MLNEKDNRINEFMAREDIKSIIIRTSTCGVVIVDKDGVIVGCNDILKRHRAVRHMQLINRKIEDVFFRGKKKDDQGNYLDPLIETLETGRVLTREFELHTSIGDETAICRVCSSPLMDDEGGFIGVCGVYYDLTPYRRKKKQLEEINQVLVQTNAQLNNQHMETIRAFANAIAARDSYTRWHSEKVAEYAQQICFSLGVDEEMANMAYLAGLLHDVGKIGVPEAILTKPGRLTDFEFNIIKKHPTIGVDILDSMQNMKNILTVIKHHHERFDGTGYPDRLEGDSIPLLSRVLAVADSFDAMTSDRSYRKAFPMEKAIAEIEKNVATQFDPQVVSSFMNLVQEQYISK
ncbi:HD domain-containing phosphohydrolase [Desulfoscipio gibsoniae]